MSFFRRLLLHLFNIWSPLLPGVYGSSIKSWILRRSGLCIGRDVKVNCGAKFYGRGIQIGDISWIGMNVSLISCKNGRIHIGSQCDLAPEVKITTGSHHIGPSERRAGLGIQRDVIIGNGTWVGIGCIILGGAHIGSGSIVAAGAVVLPGDYPINSILGGVPAAVIKDIGHESTTPL